MVSVSTCLAAGAATSHGRGGLLDSGAIGPPLSTPVGSPSKAGPGCQAVRPADSVTVVLLHTLAGSRGDSDRLIKI